MKSKRSKATDIKPSVKKKVTERDQGICVVCGSNQGIPNAHVIPRSAGGIGVEENIATLCIHCHHTYDNGGERELFGAIIRKYMKSKYPDWNESSLVYNKFSWLEGGCI